MFFLFFFFFNDTPTTEIYTLSLHDALPIFQIAAIALILIAASFPPLRGYLPTVYTIVFSFAVVSGDRKSTRLNSSHSQISYAVFCLKKKKKINKYLIGKVQLSTFL